MQASLTTLCFDRWRFYFSRHCSCYLWLLSSYLLISFEVKVAWKNRVSSKSNFGLRQKLKKINWSLTYNDWLFTSIPLGRVEWDFWNWNVLAAEPFFWSDVTLETRRVWEDVGMEVSVWFSWNLISYRNHSWWCQLQDSVGIWKFFLLNFLSKMSKYLFTCWLLPPSRVELSSESDTRPLFVHQNDEFLWKIVKIRKIS